MLLNDVALTVSDPELSAEFYGQHFGLSERVHDDEHLLILGSPDGSLVALSGGPVPNGLPRTNHFGFQLKDAEEVRSMRERLRRVKAATAAEHDHDGALAGHAHKGDSRASHGHSHFQATVTAL